MSVTIISVTQDEPINGQGDGDTGPDASIDGSTVYLRSERAGGGNGRVYVIAYVADDGNGGSCQGAVSVSVRKNPRSQAIDDGQ